ncbi:MAG TPA: hypothetical protein VLE27_13935, partial [Thermoanaerobaculia bacterium]|nr:hypothetical protein [Thermoanaerobaculia bacterium]
MSRTRFAVVLLGLLCALPSVALGQAVAFVDESGAAAPVYPERGRAFVRVTHAAANVTSGRDTVSVELTSSRAGDTETLQLSETGPSTGTFLGSIPLAPDDSSQTGVLETGTDPNPPYTRDTIQVSYTAGSTVTDTATMVGSILRFEDAQGRPTTVFGRGERLYLRVVAPLENDPINENSLAVPVQGNIETENAYLFETGRDTGVFVGGLDTQLGAGNLNNGVLEFDLQGGAVTATFQDSDVPTSSQAVAMVGESRTTFVDAQGAPAEHYLESTRAYIQVFYDFLSPYSPDTIDVTVSSVNAGDSETLSLQETGPDTGLFTGSIPLGRSAYPYPGNLTVETLESGPPYQFDTLNVSFQGSYGTSSDTVATLGSLTWFLDAEGNEAASYVGGQTIHLRVEDHNFDYAFGTDTVTATVQSLSTQDAETVTLIETGRNTGVFEGALESQPGGPPALSNGRLEVNAGESIQAMHTDANGVLASGALARIEYAGIAFVDEAGRTTVELLEKGVVRLRVLSPGDNNLTTVQETIEAQVTSLYAGDSETVPLTETGPDTGVFEGTILLFPSYPASSNGILETQNSGPPEHLWDEVTASYANATATARMAPARVEFLDAFGRVTGRLVAGAPVRVRVTDFTRNTAS